MDKENDPLWEAFNQMYADFDFPPGEWDSEVLWQFFKAGIAAEKERAKSKLYQLYSYVRDVDTLAYRMGLEE